MKGIIGIPTGVSSRWSVFYESLEKLKRPDGVEVKIQRGNAVATNRNKIVEEALRLKADWVFFLDDDLIFEENVLLRLLARNVDAVVGLSLQRRVPFAPLAYRLENKEYRQLNLTKEMNFLIEIDASTAGGFLVKRKVLEKINPPYFKSGQVSTNEAGEDLYFCQKIKEAGFKLYLDLETHFGHITDFAILPKRTNEGWRTTLIQSIPFVDIPPAGAETWKS